MQHGYRYELTETAGRNFHPGFRPDLTPKQMLELGVFGGKYMTDTRAEFPKSWFTKARISPQRSDPACNYFGVHASQPLSVWRKKGWIHPDDPRGWFQWYCRYYTGPPHARRRSPPNQTLDGDPAPYRAGSAQLRARESQIVTASRGRPCFIGPMIAGRYERSRPRQVRARPQSTAPK